jgi:hypothetical protein
MKFIQWMAPEASLLVALAQQGVEVREHHRSAAISRQPSRGTIHQQPIKRSEKESLK